jgi:hypothetical protein
MRCKIGLRFVSILLFFLSLQQFSGQEVKNQIYIDNKKRKVKPISNTS